MKTTLNKIKECDPCSSGWNTLLKSLGKTTADDEPLLFSAIAKSNGVEDAMWVYRHIRPGHETEIKLFAIWCVEQVVPLMKDSRSVKAVEVAKAFILGKVTFEELEQARASSYATDASSSYATDASSYAAFASFAASSSAASSSATDASSFAYAASSSATDASSFAAARQEMRDRQKTELIRVCDCIDRGEDPYPQ